MLIKYCFIINAFENMLNYTHDVIPNTNLALSRGLEDVLTKDLLFIIYQTISRTMYCPYIF